MVEADVVVLGQEEVVALPAVDVVEPRLGAGLPVVVVQPPQRAGQLQTLGNDERQFAVKARIRRNFPVSPR